MGYEFGTLIYILDAYEDFAGDVKHDGFNALKAAYNITEATLPQHISDKVLQKLDRLRENICSIIQALPIGSDLSQVFTLRLESNLNSRTHQKLRILKRSCNTTAVKLTLQHKWDWARKRTHQVLEQQGKHSEVGFLRIREISLNAYHILLATFFPQIALAQESKLAGVDDPICWGGALCLCYVVFVKNCCMVKKEKPEVCCCDSNK